MGLTQFVDPTAVVAVSFGGSLDVSYDDAVKPGIADALDEYLATLGWVPDAGAVPVNGTGYIVGLSPSYRAGAQVQIAPGRCRSDDDTFDLVSAGTLAVDITVAGANGLDTGVEAPSTWYFLWLIADASGVNPVAGLLSASSTAPVMPAGYDRKRRVGSVRNDPAGNFRNFAAMASGPLRQVQYLDALAGRQILAAGAAVARTNVSAAAAVPPTTRFGCFQIRAVAIGTNLFAGAVGDIVRSLPPAGQLDGVLALDTLQQIAYQNQAVLGATDIWVTGYMETV